MKRFSQNPLTLLELQKRISVKALQQHRQSQKDILGEDERD
jgi:hypothetical protein